MNNGKWSARSQALCDALAAQLQPQRIPRYGTLANAGGNRARQEWRGRNRLKRKVRWE